MGARIVLARRQSSRSVRLYASPYGRSLVRAQVWVRVEVGVRLALALTPFPSPKKVAVVRE